MMNELKTTTKLVKHILETDEKARNSDSYLYIKVLECKGGADVLDMPVGFVFENMKQLGVPGFETVRRTRQKIQQDFPELSGNDMVELGRLVREDRFREYARSGA